VLRWLKTVVVSDREKARLTRQVGTRKTFQKAPARETGVGVRF
jgi:protein required for attachment to host cells